MWWAAEAATVTENRAGTNIYNDGSLVEHGTAKLEDCALIVLATVVSTPTATRAVIDAGSKSLTSDLFGLDGFGHIVDHPGARIVSLSEEHASFTTLVRLRWVIASRSSPTMYVLSRTYSTSAGF